MQALGGGGARQACVEHSRLSDLLEARGMMLGRAVSLAILLVLPQI